MAGLVSVPYVANAVRCLAAGLLASSVGSCTVGPDFHAPAAPQIQNYTPEPLPDQTASAAVPGGQPQHFVPGMDIPGQWWTLFRSEPLDALIQKALKANPNLDVSRATLRQAQENVNAQVGFYYPTVQGYAGISQQNFDFLQVFGLTYAPLYTVNATISYSPDVFGLNRRTVESLSAQSESQQFALEAAYLTLTSDLVVAAVQEASLREQIETNRRIVDLDRQSLDLLRREQKLGQAGDVDVAAQEAALAQAQAALPPLEQQLAQERDLIAALAGDFPSEASKEQFNLSSLRLPEDLPVSLPSKLIQQRPDIRSAEAQLHSASANVGVAIANRLPDFTLTGVLGANQTSIGKLITAPVAEYSILGTAVHTLFDGGTLEHKQKAAEAAYDQAEAQYRSTVISAVQNVADALQALGHDADAVNSDVAAERAASKSLVLARARVQMGANSYLSLLSAEQAEDTAQLNLVQAVAGRYADTAALFQALGGGWWNRNDVDQPQTVQRSDVP